MKYLHKTETYSNPQRLPFLPLKDTVIFPYVMTPLFLQSDEPTLSGRVLPEGGIKEKTLAGRRTLPPGWNLSRRLHSEIG